MGIISWTYNMQYLLKLYIKRQKPLKAIFISSLSLQAKLLENSAWLGAAPSNISGKNFLLHLILFFEALFSPWLTLLFYHGKINFLSSWQVGLLTEWGEILIFKYVVFISWGHDKVDGKLNCGLLFLLSRANYHAVVENHRLFSTKWVNDTDFLRGI